MQMLRQELEEVLRWLRSPSPSRTATLLKRELFILVQVGRGLRDEEVSRRAAALTYHTLLALVPLLAVAFALFKAFGGFQKLQGPLEQLIFSQLAIANPEQVASWLQGFVEKVNGGAVAGVGLLVLFYTAATLLTNIEEAFNRVWNVRMRRPLYVRLAIYWCLLTLAPPVVALSISFSTHILDRTVSAWFGAAAAAAFLTLLSPITVALVFFVVYFMVPDTHVPWRNALIGGFAAALCWNVAKAGFVWMTRTASTQSAIYGAMSALPLLMVWLYTSWYIVLFGASYACARGQVRLSLNPEPPAAAPNLRLLSRVVVALWEHFHEGRAITAEGIAQEVGLTIPMSRKALDVLVDHGFAECTGTEEVEGTEYLLRRHLGDLSLAELDNLLVDPLVRASEAKLTPSPMWKAVEERLGRAESTRNSILAVTVQEATEGTVPKNPVVPFAPTGVGKTVA